MLSLSWLKSRKIINNPQLTYEFDFIKKKNTFKNVKMFKPYCLTGIRFIINK